MQLSKATRIHTKIKMAIQGPSGSGKTYSSLLIAFGLCEDWNKIAVIDSENESSNLYAELGEYNVVSISPPFTPEKFIEALDFCKQSDMKVVIIDSISHEWEGTGGILDTHSRMAGNSFTNWAKLTPRHNTFLQAILQSPMHVIATLRTKQDYVLTEKNGKQVPEKVGLRSIQRDGTDYEFTLVFDLDIKHYATASKDRTRLFVGKPECMLSIETGHGIKDWCLMGSPSTIKTLKTDSMIERINDCRSVEELLDLYTSNPQDHTEFLPEFTRKRQELQPRGKAPIVNAQNHPQNGTNK